MSKVERESVITVYCDRAKKEVTVVIGYDSDGHTVYSKVLCPHLYHSWGGKPLCHINGAPCGIAEGAAYNY